jgi:hypothetical protein
MRLEFSLRLGDWRAMRQEFYSLLAVSARIGARA